MGIFLAGLVLYPILKVFWESTLHNILTRPDEGIYFVGLDNYIKLAQDPTFWHTLGRTIAWTTISVSAKVVAGFIFAMLLADRFAFRRLYLTLLMIPWVTPIVVASVTFRWIYNGDYGDLNYYLQQLHITSSSIAWLGHGVTAFFAAMTIDVWVGVPFMAIALMGGIQGIPEELYEAASMDGAGMWTRLWRITIPQLMPVIFVTTTLSAVWTFNSFQAIWPLTGGGPVNATQTLVVMTYQTAFGAFDMGRGSALATITFAILITFSVIYWRRVRPR